ncbi:hypothetical protein EJB05_26471, partial [Eragrostis curvula]
LAHLIDSSSDKYVIAGLLSSASSGGEGAAAIQIDAGSVLPMAAASSPRLGAPANGGGLEFKAESDSCIRLGPRKSIHRISREERDEVTMAGSFKKCSEEALQKALADSGKSVSQGPIPDELKFRPNKGKASNKNEEEKKKRKKKLYRLSPDDAEMILSIGSEPMFPETKHIDQLAKEKKGVYQDLSSMASILKEFAMPMHYDDRIRATQERLRQEILHKGYVTVEVEVTDDEADEEDAESQQGARSGQAPCPEDGVNMPAGGRVN